MTINFRSGVSLAMASLAVAETISPMMGPTTSPQGSPQGSPQDPALPRPIVKWAGGKTRLLSELTRRMPAHFGAYHEPFAGGAALFFHESRRLADGGHPVLLSDINDDLVSAYRAVADDPQRVSVELDGYRASHDEVHYYETRRAWNARLVADMNGRGHWSPAKTAACFLYLNRAGYNGLWRVNARGEHNVPVGRSSSGGPPSFPSAEDLRIAAWALRSATVGQRHFLDATALAESGDLDATALVESGDFVYFAPPYVPLGKSPNFTAYNAGGFDADDHAVLAERSRDLARRGVHVMLSNSDTPMVRELYRDFRVEVVTAPRSINSKGLGRGKINELVITSGYEARGEVRS